MSEHESAYCILTPRNRGAVASIWIRSPNVEDHLDVLFQPLREGTFSTLCHANDVIYGTWRSGDSAGEDVVVHRLDAQSVEVHTHGGNAVTDAIETTLARSGFVNVAADEYLLRNESNLWTVEIKSALIRATTQDSALMLLRQLEILPNEITKIKALVTKQDFANAIIRVENILSWADFGRHLTSPFQIVLFGEPNVGKSSLINALAGFNRTIVHETPGTTRDSISHLTAMNGWAVEIRDTAGIRRTTDEIENKGIEVVYEVVEKADLLIQVSDPSTQKGTLLEYEELNQRIAEKPVLKVWNKIDVTSEETRKSLDLERQQVLVSALHSEGIDQLINVIIERLVPQSPSVDQAIPVSSRQIERLESCLTALRNADSSAAIQVVTQ